MQLSFLLAVTALVIESTSAIPLTCPAGYYSVPKPFSGNTPGQTECYLLNPIVDAKSARLVRRLTNPPVRTTSAPLNPTTTSRTTTSTTTTRSTTTTTTTTRPTTTTTTTRSTTTTTPSTTTRSTTTSPSTTTTTTRSTTTPSTTTTTTTSRTTTTTTTTTSRTTTTSSSTTSSSSTTTPSTTTASSTSSSTTSSTSSSTTSSTTSPSTTLIVSPTLVSTTSSTTTSSTTSTTSTTSTSSTSSTSLVITTTTTTSDVLTTTTASTTTTNAATSTNSGTCATQTGLFVLQGSNSGDFTADGNFALLQQAFGSGYRLLFSANRQNAQQFKLAADCVSLVTADGNLQAMIGDNGQATLHYQYFFPSTAAASALVNVNWQADQCTINADNTLTCTAGASSIFQITQGDPTLELGTQNFGETITVNVIPVPAGIF